MLKIIILGYLLIINLVGYNLMRVDKHRAERHEWRIPESTLFGTALFGGALGVWRGMQAFRHKTQHLSFKIGIPLLLIVNVVVAIFLLVVLP